MNLIERLIIQELIKQAEDKRRRARFSFLAGIPGGIAGAAIGEYALGGRRPRARTVSIAPP